ncbi:MAG: N-6 DNA methylase [Planctomycetes bacterium]|nr:N-6 DNA methylase [Planctomycetota bacterium]MBU4400719.1 N-6 DNA methylase [Planctomycetota bacterium]MCG2682874.1 N-6 DNA methylase [Planctomycetales bacterium]
MSKTFDQGKEEVVKLCKHFTTNRQQFFAPGIKEAHIRQMLIDPFFEALGWDLRNAAMAAPQYREVIPEDSLDVEGQQKAPDYTFRVGTLPKYYVEAKKCGVNINTDSGPAYQLRRYGWSAKLALSILTDFEELAVYDCTIRPKQSDKASRARVLYFRYQEYPDRWRELWDLFSREAVWSGAFDRYAASKRKRGTSEVDVEFLKEIEGWRNVLARNIALRNKNISSDDLNAAVQSTIDRVIFLRMAEDRRLEPYEQLLKLCEQDDIYPRFMRDLCRKADDKYNSGLFHFHKEQDTDEKPDRITPKLKVDDKVFKPILQSLYFAHGSPYHFGVLPVEILGTIYERFLGKVIRLTAGHQAKVEEKPEVRKAGGVYYTPAYIVDYIVQHTVGRQIKDRSPMQLAGLRNGKQPFRVLDMACGSGSFLLGAYQCLLEYCLKWYIEHNPEKYKKAVYKDSHDGHWRLTVGEKKRILTTHIFGVDIDAQAVEVTKLSLLLKVLEGETDQSVSQQQRLFHDRALPNLSDNIKGGNSLIGPDYFTGELISDPNEMKRVNPFDWKQGFPDAMKAGGFDCVIGNPPWVFTREGDFDEAMKKYIDSLYLKGLEGSQTGRAKQSGKINLFAIFMLKSIALLKEQGHFGYIVPNTLLRATVYDVIRKRVLDSTRIRIVADLGSGVFEGVTASTVILILEKGSAHSKHLVDIMSEFEVASAGTTTKVLQSSFLDNTSFAFNLYSDTSSDVVTQKIVSKSLRLGEISTIHAGGIATGPGKSDYIRNTKVSGAYKPLIEGKDIKRYLITFSNRFILYDRRKLYRARDETIFLTPEKLVTQRIAGGDHALVVGYDDQQLYTFNSTNTILRDLGKPYSLKFVLGLLNSQVLNWYYILSYTNRSQLTVNISKTYLEQLPIPCIDFSVPAQKAYHDRMVKLVDSMLALHKQLAAAKSEAQKTVIQRQIDATDAEIDRLVYDLYGLTPEEISIVEEATK